MVEVYKVTEGNEQTGQNLYIAGSEAADRQLLRCCLRMMFILTNTREKACNFLLQKNK